RVRTAVDRLQQRPLALRVEVRRVGDEYLHRLAVPSGHFELANLAESMAREQRAVVRVELPLCRAVAGGREERGRMCGGVAGVDEHAAVGRLRVARDGATADDNLRRPVAIPAGTRE